ncbi:hypothetical protein LJB83_03290, partial [Clostridia bacterium OttesenSCG-928-F22]|nr:hypothetical protein [Clostridia bacterium OttesenSCG-928-F22]
MEWIYFAGAIFVFLLFITVYFFFDRYKRSRKEEEEGPAGFEKRLFTLYQNLEDMVNSVEEYIEESTEEIKAEREEIKAEREELKAEIRKEKEAVASMLEKVKMLQKLMDEKQKEDNKKEKKVQPQPIPTPAEEVKSIAEPQPPVKEVPELLAPEQKNQSKANRVRQLKRQGMDEEKIAQELSLSRGEVS